MDSEFQKQEALQSLEVAKRALRENNREKARKFALKAKKLCSCPEVEAFLAELSSATPSSSNAAPNLRRRTAKPPTQDQGTEEQRALILKIRRAKDFYETLDVSKDASEEDIKRAYKKLALKLHPDKNKAAGAEEAFKAVSRAFSCLSDEEKRKNYDTYGTEDRAPMAGAAHHHDFYQEDFDPQEIFNMFFGGQFPVNGARVYRTNFHGPFARHGFSSRNRQEEEAGETINLGGLVRLLPLLLLFIFSFFSSSPAPVFSLHRDYNYSNKILTKSHKIPFFVKSKTYFERTYPSGTPARHQLETQVEETFKIVLEDQCRQEKITRRRVQRWQGKEAAEHFPLNSCIQLERIFFSSKTEQAATQNASHIILPASKAMTATVNN